MHDWHSAGLTGGTKIFVCAARVRVSADLRPAGRIVRALHDSKWYVRQAGAQALGRLKDPRAIKGLRKAAFEPRRAVARAARKALKAYRER